MKGRIKTIWVESSNHKPSWGFITGEDGIDYHFERRDSINWKSTWKVDNIVEFDPSTNPREDSKWYGQPIAINVRKVGYGKHHPFAKDMQRIGEYLSKYIPDDEEKKQYLLSDIDTIYQYFRCVEDANTYTDIKAKLKDSQLNR